MIIHKGDRYTITASGETAEKTDGKTTLRMKFFPQRDAEALAGEIDELTAWTLLRDIATQCRNTATPVSPAHILITDDGFTLAEWSRSHDGRFTAPEGYDPVWALAASLFFIFLGTYPFQGLGGKGQTRTAPVPTLRRALPELSRLVNRCLSHDPARRPSLDEINYSAEANIARCRRNQSEFPPLRVSAPPAAAGTRSDTAWPENFY